MKKVQIEDCHLIGSLEFIEWEKLRNSRIVITGSTGLIGSTFVNCVAYNNEKKKLNIKLTLLVRNPSAANAMFKCTDAEIIQYNLGDEVQIEGNIDYIVHLASPTSSQYFISNPVDTLMMNIRGTQALLELARKYTIKKMIICSSMEVYGYHERGHLVQENELGSFETMNSRNSYPLGKLACESLCYGYYSQYQIPVSVLRVTQTFGPGVKYEDGRIFAELMRCVIENRDIILKTPGLTERSYLYTADCVSAIIIGLLKALPGEAYSVANPDTYCSIRDMAEMVAHEVAKNRINVVYDIIDDVSKLGYADTLYMNLDVSKIEKLGWRPQKSLPEMFKRMIDGID